MRSISITALFVSVLSEILQKALLVPSPNAFVSYPIYQLSVPTSQLLCALLLKVCTWNLQMMVVGCWSHCWHGELEVPPGSFLSPSSSLSPSTGRCGSRKSQLFCHKTEHIFLSSWNFPCSLLASSGRTSLKDCAHSNSYLRWVPSFSF